VTLILVPCAVCGGSDFARIYPSGLDPSLDASAYFSSSRVSAAYPEIVRCKACDLMMANPRDDEETLARVYGSMSDPAYDDEDANRSFSAAEHQRLVLSQKSPPARLLDMGCASGFFVAKASEAGFDAMGADASSWMIERARARVPGAKFEVGTIESLKLDAEFDVITLWDVLEHVHSPRQVLERLRDFLKPGGLLMMSMPNSASWVARVLGPRWMLLLREHLWYFSPETIGKLLPTCGFELVHTESKRVSFSLANVAIRLSQYGGALAPLKGWANARALKNASVRFPIGEMNVVARKL
jgi:2-polyprenyl-3-methyl-5-hydroxy-6-metoxy-1,4-benzoquinol methylase